LLPPKKVIPRVSLRTSTALIAAAVMVVVAVGAGAAVGIVTRPVPTPAPTSTPASAASPTSEPDSGPLVFQQPLTGGCATEGAVWVVSNGGGIGRFDGQRWRLIDATLRSLVAVACGEDSVLAVGPGGRVVTINDRAKTIQPDDLGPFDAHGISLVADGALVVGSEGNVQRQTSAGWQPFARGIEEDLFGVAGFGGASAWMVGAGGVSYRLEDAGWRPFATGTSAVLRTVAGASPGDAVAAGDDGVLLRFDFDGRWRPLESGVQNRLRAAVRAGAVTYVAGDRGVALAIEENNVQRIDLGTTCALHSVFARGNEVWFVGSEGTRAGVWRRSGDRVERWGTC
jgi:hypothetical protein